MVDNTELLKLTVNSTSSKFERFPSHSWSWPDENLVLLLILVPATVWKWKEHGKDLLDENGQIAKKVITITSTTRCAEMACQSQKQELTQLVQKSSCR
jgi:hypothetical protein